MTRTRARMTPDRARMARARARNTPARGRMTCDRARITPARGGVTRDRSRDTTDRARATRDRARDTRDRARQAPEASPVSHPAAPPLGPLASSPALRFFSPPGRAPPKWMKGLSARGRARAGGISAGGAFLPSDPLGRRGSPQDDKGRGISLQDHFSEQRRRPSPRSFGSPRLPAG